ncbi:hypothetical protein [Cellvibrio mixtus]|uniref:hypothetical protein n=1 Tax=Cellvibrio mixtus TaxID=39650 RepID=UPI000586E3B2|nr:hypothetical protein [Cellvibrio mixtus]
MSQSTQQNDYLDTSEEFITLPDTERFPIDSINCAKLRASAILSMLINEFGCNEEQTLGTKTVANALWAIDGYLNQIEIMINHSYKTMHPYIYLKQPTN